MGKKRIKMKKNLAYKIVERMSKKEINKETDHFKRKKEKRKKERKKNRKKARKFKAGKRK